MFGLVSDILYTVFSYLVIFLVVLKLFSVKTTGRCKSMTCLVGKTALITGGNSGIGYHVALVLASRGCRVIIADRDDATASKDKIIRETKNDNIVVKHVDLASFDSVRSLAKNILETEDKLDILVNNAGVGNGGNKYTVDGNEATMQINYLSHFLLTNLLTGLLKKSAPSRVVFTSSIMAYINTINPKKLNYPEWYSLDTITSLFPYANSKFCQIAAAKGFAERLKGSGVTCNSVHPGGVKTGIFDKTHSDTSCITKRLIGILVYFYGKSVEEGAQTSLHVALSEEGGEVSGKFFFDCVPFFEPINMTASVVEEIWKESEKLVKLEDHEKLAW